jgi:hypothetical protein
MIPFGVNTAMVKAPVFIGPFLWPPEPNRAKLDIEKGPGVPAMGPQLRRSIPGLPSFAPMLGMDGSPLGPVW